MSDFTNRFQVVVLKSPYDFMRDKQVRSLFSDICDLKITGYSKEYPDGVLPLDASDFVANHIVLLEKTSMGMLPIMGFKSISLGACDRHRVNFPILGMLKSAQDTSAHHSYFERMLADYRARGAADTLAYNGSFTVHPEKRSDEKFMAHMWDLVFFMISSHYITEKTERVVAVCATKFKVDHKKTTRGWAYCEETGKRLERYSASSLYEADLIPMEMTNIRENCQVHADRFKDLWENRVVHALDQAAKKKAA